MIEQYGDVTVSQDEVRIHGFIFDDIDSASREAMEWAIKRLNEELAKEKQQEDKWKI